MNKDRLIPFTQELIREVSISGEEQGVVSRIQSEMLSLGFDEVMIDELGSVIGIINGTRPGKTLLLDGHCDIVGAEAADWKYDPFGGVIADGWLYGRGVADMKAALAAMICAAADVDRQQLIGRVIVSGSVLEEVMEGAALKVIMDKYRPDYVIIGESTELNLNRAGRGRAELVAETFGKSAHSSSPQFGLCAVHEMIKLIHKLETVSLRSDPVIGDSQVTLTDIISDPFPGHSVVPYHCQASFDVRTVPGETAESLMQVFRSIPDIQSIDHKLSFLEGEEKAYTGLTVHGQKFFPAWIFDEEHELVQSAWNGLRQIGMDPKLGSFKFCTNGAYSAGIAGVPTIGFGPGRESDAHSTNEKLGVDEILLAYDGFHAMIQSIMK